MKKICGVIIVLCLAVFFLLTTTSITPAEEAGPFYVGIFGGFVIPQDLELEGHGNSEDIDLDNSWAIGAKAGYIIPAVKWLAVELEYTYLAKQDFDKSEIDGDFSAHNAMANLLFRYPDGRIHPYAGGGIGWSWGDVKGKYEGDSFDSSDNAFAWQLIAGVNFDIMQNLSVDLGYKYFTSKYDVASDAEVKDHIILLGITYYFGGEKEKTIAREVAAQPEVVAPPPPPPPPPPPCPPCPPCPAPVTIEKPEVIMQPVFFDFDKYNIRPDAEETLQKNLQWFKDNPGKGVRIEASCDTRGSVSYNRKLAQRRADSVKDWLISHGVDGNLLLATIFGKVESFDSAKTEEGYQMNRRVQFVPRR